MLSHSKPNTENELTVETIVNRLTVVLPAPLIHELFTSHSQSTGGIAKFPYCRVDAELINSSARIETFEMFGVKDQEDFIRIYTHACRSAFKAAVWVQIGFQGLEHLADHPASVNWTCRVGHLVTPQERASGIKTAGKELYIKNLQQFNRFRQTNRVVEDLFTEHGLEYLLNDFWA